MDNESLTSSCHSDSEEYDDICFICLDGPREKEPLVHPCSCPRRVHAACLAKWQLTSAGRDEETWCRFCHAVLPDWRPALTPTQLKPTASVMSVRYRGVTYRITYTPGPDGLQHFLETLQSIGIKVATASQVTFLCRSPDTGEEMSLKGLKAFDAAAYCASITAAKRQLKDQDRRQRRHQAALAQQQQQQQIESSPHSDHDLGVRPEGPESPRGVNACETGNLAHVHAEAGSSGSASGHSAAEAQAHADRAHAMFYTAASSAVPVPQQQVQQCSWWRRALSCMHINTPQRQQV